MAFNGCVPYLVEDKFFILTRDESVEIGQPLTQPPVVWRDVNATEGCPISTDIVVDLGGRLY